MQPAWRESHRHAGGTFDLNSFNQTIGSLAAP